MRRADGMFSLTAEGAKGQVTLRCRRCQRPNMVFDQQYSLQFNINTDIVQDVRRLLTFIMDHLHDSKLSPIEIWRELLMARVEENYARAVKVWEDLLADRLLSQAGGDASEQKTREPGFYHKGSY